MPETSCCPDCESAQIYTTSAHTMHDRVSEYNWKCRECGHKFDAPQSREAKNPLGQDDPTAPPNGTVAAKLDEMDPDDLGGAA